MDQIKKQIACAQRRLFFQQWLRVTAWCWFACLLVAATAIVVPKIWALPLLADESAATTWVWGWLGGALLLGLVMSSLWSWITRQSSTDAAIEIDQRLGLKERVSSVFTLNRDELESAAGQALLSDATKRIDRLDVPEAFSCRPRLQTALPLIPIVVALMLVWLVPNAVIESSASATETELETKRRVEISRDALKKRVDQQLEQAKAKGLKDAAVVLKEIQKEVERIDGNNPNSRKEALVKLNNIKKQLDQRKKQLGDVDGLKKQLSGLKQIKQGPASEFSNAMQSGEYGKANQQLKDLANQLGDNQLTEQQKQELAKQLKELQDKLQEMVDKQKQAAEELEKQIEQARQQGDREKADSLQRQLDQLKQQSPQMQQMQDLANKLGQCANCMQGQNGQQPSDQQIAQAQQALNELADQLQQMQNASSELETLQDVMQQIADAKGMINGEGDFADMMDMAGGMFGAGQNGFGQNTGSGMGEGRGQGTRPIEETETGHYRSRVRAKPGEGEAVVTGNVGGANVAGMTLSQVQEQIQSANTQESDPLANQRLPRSLRDHSKEYFDRLRDGNKK